MFFSTNTGGFKVDPDKNPIIYEEVVAAAIGMMNFWSTKNELSFSFVDFYNEGIKSCTREESRGYVRELIKSGVLSCFDFADQADVKRGEFGRIRKIVYLFLKFSKLPIINYMEKKD